MREKIKKVFQKVFQKTEKHFVSPVKYTMILLSLRQSSHNYLQELLEYVYHYPVTLGLNNSAPHFQEHYKIIHVMIIYSDQSNAASCMGEQIRILNSTGCGNSNFGSGPIFVYFCFNSFLISIYTQQYLFLLNLILAFCQNIALKNQLLIKAQQYEVCHPVTLKLNSIANLSFSIKASLPPGKRATEELEQLSSKILVTKIVPQIIKWLSDTLILSSIELFMAYSA